MADNEHNEQGPALAAPGPPIRNNRANNNARNEPEHNNAKMDPPPKQYLEIRDILLSMQKMDKIDVAKIKKMVDDINKILAPEKAPGVPFSTAQYREIDAQRLEESSTTRELKERMNNILTYGYHDRSTKYAEKNPKLLNYDLRPEYVEVQGDGNRKTYVHQYKSGEKLPDCIDARNKQEPSEVLKTCYGNVNYPLFYYLINESVRLESKLKHSFPGRALSIKEIIVIMLDNFEALMPRLFDRHYHVAEDEYYQKNMELMVMDRKMLANLYKTLLSCYGPIWEDFKYVIKKRKKTTYEDYKITAYDHMTGKLNQYVFPCGSVYGKIEPFIFTGKLSESPYLNIRPVSHSFSKSDNVHFNDAYQKLQDIFGWSFQERTKSTIDRFKSEFRPFVERKVTEREQAAGRINNSELFQLILINSKTPKVHFLLGIEDVTPDDLVLLMPQNDESGAYQLDYDNKRFDTHLPKSEEGKIYSDEQRRVYSAYRHIIGKGIKLQHILEYDAHDTVFEDKLGEFIRQFSENIKLVHYYIYIQSKNGYMLNIDTLNFLLFNAIDYDGREFAALMFIAFYTERIVKEYGKDKKMTDLVDNFGKIYKESKSHIAGAIYGKIKKVLRMGFDKGTSEADITSKINIILKSFENPLYSLKYVNVNDGKAHDFFDISQNGIGYANGVILKYIVHSDMTDGGKDAGQIKTAKLNGGLNVKVDSEALRYRETDHYRALSGHLQNPYGRGTEFNLTPRYKGEYNELEGLRLLLSFYTFNYNPISFSIQNGAMMDAGGPYRIFFDKLGIAIKSVFMGIAKESNTGDHPLDSILRENVVDTGITSPSDMLSSGMIIMDKNIHHILNIGYHAEPDGKHLIKCLGELKNACATNKFGQLMMSVVTLKTRILNKENLGLLPKEQLGITTEFDPEADIDFNKLKNNALLHYIDNFMGMLFEPDKEFNMDYEYTENKMVGEGNNATVKKEIKKGRFSVDDFILKQTILKHIEHRLATLFDLKNTRQYGEPRVPPGDEDEQKAIIGTSKNNALLLRKSEPTIRQRLNRVPTSLNNASIPSDADVCPPESYKDQLSDTISSDDRCVFSPSQKILETKLNMKEFLPETYTSADIYKDTIAEMSSQHLGDLLPEVLAKIIFNYVVYYRYSSGVVALGAFKLSYLIHFLMASMISNLTEREADNNIRKLIFSKLNPREHNELSMNDKSSLLFFMYTCILMDGIELSSFDINDMENIDYNLDTLYNVYFGYAENQTKNLLFLQKFLKALEEKFICMKQFKRINKILNVLKYASKWQILLENPVIIDRDELIASITVVGNYQSEPRYREFFKKALHNVIRNIDQKHLITYLRILTGSGRLKETTLRLEKYPTKWVNDNYEYGSHDGQRAIVTAHTCSSNAEYYAKQYKLNADGKIVNKGDRGYPQFELVDVSDDSQDMKALEEEIVITLFTIVGGERLIGGGQNMKTKNRSSRRRNRKSVKSKLRTSGKPQKASRRNKMFKSSKRNNKPLL